MFNYVSFLSYFLILTPSVNVFAELLVILVSELRCHVGVNFERHGFELYIYIYIYIYNLLRFMSVAGLKLVYKTHTHIHRWYFNYMHA